MKKIVFTMAMLAVALAGFAQKKNVSRAENALYEPTESNLRSAVTDIEAAMQDPTTANQAKTYYVAGQVYYKIYEKESEKQMLKQSFDQKVKDEFLVKAIDAFAKTAELDERPDEKGKVKPKYTKDLKKNLGTYSQYLINEGLVNYNENNYKKAYDLWGKFLETYTYPILVANGTKKDSLYFDIKYYSMTAALNVPEMKPQVIRLMEELKDAGYGATLSARDSTKNTPESVIYQWLYDQYNAQNDTAKFVKLLQDGVNKYPGDMYLMGNLINYYINSNKTDEAVAYLDNAIKNDPKNPQYYAIKGNLLLNGKKDFDEAIALYNKAAGLDPSYFLAQAGLGLAYVTKAEEIFNKAGAIKDNKKYEAEKKRARDEFEKSLPYLEKARELNPQDVDNLKVLRAAYLRLDRGKDFDRIDAEIKRMEKK
jgi:tetratricopeptide (TPR) repeat protein